MRAVIDTSVLVRALIRPQGSVGPILHQLRNGTYTLLYSDDLLEEFVSVLNRPRISQKYHVTREDVMAALRLLVLRGEPVLTQERLSICRDPKDNHVLEIAIAGGADVIVSGDQDLIVPSPFRGIHIVGPAEFLKMLAAASDDAAGPS